jgi:hypothetical protein
MKHSAMHRCKDLPLPLLLPLIALHFVAQHAPLSHLSPNQMLLLHAAAQAPRARVLWCGKLD